MAKDRENAGGPTYRPKDAPVPDPATHRKAQSRDELQERSVHGERPGRGQRNGSAKKK
jgi:hypothetical protein